MAQQKKKGRILALLTTPYLLAIEIAHSVLVSTKYEPKVAAFGLIVSITAATSIFFWLYRFSKSKQTEELMTNVI